MDKRTIKRREFLKLLGASATAAGLSHFRFLNLGVRPAFAQDLKCGDANGDQCIPQQDPDVCIEPSGGDGDLCLPPDEPDICAGPEIPADQCINIPGHEADVCEVQEGDSCLPPADPDQCEPLQTPAPDTCGKAYDDVDICPDGPGGDGDLCGVSAEGFTSPDICEPRLDPTDPETCDPAQSDPDVCDPGDQSPDPGGTAVRLASLTARPAAAGLPMLGGVAAGAAFLWVLRRRMKHSRDEEAGA